MSYVQPKLLNGTLLTWKQVDIGDWDMDSTDDVTVAHGLSATEWKTVRNIQVIIRNDADTEYFLLYTQLGAEPEMSWDSTNVNIPRDLGGDYDNSNFDSTSYNRGWVILLYTPD